MNRRRLLFATLLLTLAITAGCRSHREMSRPPTPPQAETTDETAEPTATPAPRYRTAAFSATVQGTTVNGQIRMLEDSVIWLSATKIIELGRAMITPDSVVVYAKVAGRCFRGSYQDVYRRFRWRTDYATLQEMLTGDNAGTALEGMARRFNIEATVRLEPWKEVERTTFPMAIPPQVKPL